MKVLLTTLNSKYIHKNLAIRWLYVTRPKEVEADIQEYTINDDLDSIMAKMHIEEYDVVGLSTYIWNSEMTKAWIYRIREAKPSIKIILGGPEVTYDNDSWFDTPIDAISVGEGEKELWKYIVTGKSTCTKEKKGQLTEIGRVDLKWLEQFENPYFLEFDRKEMYQRYLYVETSRGCPFGCSYCLSERDRAVRTFSEEYMENVYSEMEKFHIRQVKFLDRTFNLNYRKSLKTIQRLEKIRSVDSFAMELVAENLPEEMITYMVGKMDKKRFRFEVGVQSFNRKTLEAVHRKSNLDKLKSVIQRLNDAGVILHTDLIAGLPYEDIHSFEDSYNQLFALYSYELQCGTLKLLKGTTLRNEAEDFGIEAEENAPYEVQKTHWLSKEDVELVEMAALGTEKAYNNKRLSYTIKTVLQEDPSCSAFLLMAKLGEMIRGLPHPYQLREYFLQAYEVFRETLSEEKLQGALLFDYYKNTKNRPKMLFDSFSDKQWLRERKAFNEYVLDHYAVYLPLYYNGLMIHQLVIYESGNKTCRHYLVDEENNRIEEIRE